MWGRETDIYSRVSGGEETTVFTVSNAALPMMQGSLLISSVPELELFFPDFVGISVYVALAAGVFVS